MIYFIKPVSSFGPVKIGTTSLPVERRLAQLQSASPLMLEVAAACAGHAGHEALLHREFARFRLHGEWFIAAAPVLEAIKVARAGGKPAAGWDLVRTPALWDRLSKAAAEELARV